MFKGVDEQAKEKFEELDKSSDYFFFSFSDLELVKTDGDNRRRCRLLSDELSQKLHQMYSKGKSDYVPSIKFIDLVVQTNNINSFSIFPNATSLTFNYQ